MELSSFVRRVSRSSVAISIEMVRISFRVLWSWVASAASVAASETEESEDEPAVSAVAVSSIISAVIGEAGVVQGFAGFDSPGVCRFILVDRRGGCRTSATGEKQDATQKE